MFTSTIPVLCMTMQYTLRTDWGGSPTLEKPEGVARHFLAREHFEGAFPADPDIFNSRLQYRILAGFNYHVGDSCNRLWFPLE